MTRPACEHGSSGGCSLPAGGWNGPIGHCACCDATFGYIEHGTMSAVRVTGSHWTPKNRCARCGGRYETYEYDFTDHTPSN